MKSTEMQSSDALGKEIIKALGLPENITSMTLRFQAGKPLEVSVEFLNLKCDVAGLDLTTAASRYELVLSDAGKAA